jgi:tRNA pseudouridine55 synthase
MLKMDGFLLVDKAAGMTSHDVVAKVRSILRQVQSSELRVHSKDQELSALGSRLSARAPKVRVGHTGTLDPAATGLMILVLGKYTKRAGEFSKLDKTYEAEIILGKVSSTGDSEGTISKTQNVKSKKPTEKEIQKVLGTFLGEIQQTPPAFSAIKVDGQRAYRLARQGKEVKLQPRKVTVHRLQVTEYEYPTLKCTTEVSSGTYIRSLATDIGAKLGTGGYLSSLRRTQVGSFHLENALKIDDLTPSNIETRLRPA